MKYTLFFLLNNQQKQPLKKPALGSKNKFIEQVGGPYSTLKVNLRINQFLKQATFQKLIQKKLLRNTVIRILNCLSRNIRSSHRRLSIIKVLLKNFAKLTGKQLHQSICFSKVAACLIKKVTLAQVFSCELCKIYKNTYFTEHHRVTASGTC